MNIALSKQRISEFQESINAKASEIRKKAQASWDDINFSASEPLIVYEFLSRTGTGTDLLNSELTTLIGGRGRTVKFASVFLHQKPMVYGCDGRDWTSGLSARKCELGDLQLIFLYLASDKTVCQCRSIIFQAKKEVHGGEYVIEHADQRSLYDNCFGFEYASSLPGFRRRLPAGADRERALQYLFVGNQNVQAHAIPAGVGEGAFIDFGELIVRLLNDSSGLHVPCFTDAGNGWGRIVQDIVEEVAFASTSAGQIRNAQLRGLLDYFNNFEDTSKFFLDIPPATEERDNRGGFGLMFLIISDEKVGGLDERRRPVLSTIIDVSEVNQVAQWLSPLRKKPTLMHILDVLPKIGKFRSRRAQLRIFATIADLVDTLKLQDYDVIKLLDALRMYEYLKGGRMEPIIALRRVLKRRLAELRGEPRGFIS